MNGHCFVAMASQVVLKPGGSSFHGDEDQCCVIRVLIQDLLQLGGLRTVGCHQKGLLYTLRGSSDAADADPDVVSHEGLSQTLDFLGEGGREHQCHTAFCRGGHIALLNDLYDLGHEAHVQHAVSLVENQKTDGGHSHDLAINEIDEPARSRCDDVRTSSQLLQLRPGLNSAIDFACPDQGLEGQLSCLQVDLGAQFTSWCQDDRLRGCRSANLHSERTCCFLFIDARQNR
mmetsp:Transcript_77067/g.160394  ORF Transcript_77067/g.160394 Transcript_77067/m.160394 type:complete len:231 (-) Transcript_77067:760-1452(-)